MQNYADFNYYQNTYNGTDITEKETFLRFAQAASLYVDQMTLGRITEASDEVKMAVCALADVNRLEYCELNEQKVASESVGPHSKSYVTKTKSIDDFAKMKLDILKMYLANTGLLYRGIPRWSS